MPIHLNVQREVADQKILQDIPADADFKAWAEAALQNNEHSMEISLRVVEPAEIQSINRDFRNTDKVTNVLSFASWPPPGVGVDILADIVICAEVVAQEAEKYEKSLTQRWAHMLVHACLHVQGFDHTKDNQRADMEAEEIRILDSLGIPDPYQVNLP